MENTYPIGRKKMYTVLFVANLFLTIFRLLILPDFPVKFHIVTSLASLLGFWLLWEFILFTGDLLEKKFPIRFYPSTRIIIQILGTYVLATLIGEALRIGSTSILHVEFPTVLQAFGYLLFFLLSIVMNLIYFGTLYFYNWKKDLVNLSNMQREQAMVKYDVLRNQLNPHFLFNALTSLNSLIFENQQLASDFLQQLSKVYRYVLQTKENETVSISTELSFIANYISLLKTRFGGGIEFNIDITEDDKEKAIVPVTLQILIENAVKHNIISSKEPLHVSITSDHSYLVVQNNVNKKAQVESSNGQGLGNLKSFYLYLTKRPIDVIESENKFAVKIPLI